MDALIFPRTTSVKDRVPARPAGEYDFSVHDGTLGIRLVNADPLDVVQVIRQLGIRPARAYAEPDLVLRFVKRLSTRELDRIGSSGFGVDGKGRIVVDRRGRKARIDFDAVGGTCEFVCESGIGSVPLLESIADVTVLRKGYAAMHASAFSHRGRTILATAWANGGKTTALLAFAEHGAAYVSDDRVWIRGDGEVVYGFCSDVAPTEWQLRQLPKMAGRAQGRRLGLYLLGRVETACPGRGSGAPARALKKLFDHGRRRLLPTERPDRVFDEVEAGPASRPRTVFVMLRQEGASRIVVQSLRPSDLVTRATLSVQHDQRALFDAYRARRFSVPARANRFLESAAGLHHEILTSALRATEGYLVRHPPEVPLVELYRAMEPHS